MEKQSKTEVVPGPSIDPSMTARHWWSGADARLLPGEAGGVSVFAIAFADGCCFFGYTGSRVFDRVSELVMKRGAYPANDFVSGHAARVPYLVVRNL